MKVGSGQVQTAPHMVEQPQLEFLQHLYCAHGSVGFCVVTQEHDTPPLYV